MNGKGLRSRDAVGKPEVDDNIYIIFNAHSEELEYKLPSAEYSADWKVLLDTGHPDVEEGELYKAEETIKVDGRSVLVLHHPVSKDGNK